MAPAIPLDSVVLVTGVNGFIGSHIADQFLQAGYKVRGTVRKASKADGLKALWEKKYGPGQFEVVEVPEMAVKGAFDEAVKGMFLRPMSFTHHLQINVQASLEYAMRHTI
jgi:nucleoside-diphosphate-sugar epimerase